MQQVIILCPMYQDEASFNLFAAEVEKEVERIEDHRFAFLVVNDGSGPVQLMSELPLTLVHLHTNIGHQRAIAVGLAYAQKQLSFDKIIVMDCDGEDRPKDIHTLIGISNKSKKILVARRSKRHEGSRFRLLYGAYKFFFRILTGKKIAFGNFMLLPAAEVKKIVHHSEIWNHLAGAVVKSKLAFKSIGMPRGKRYEGKSKMNFNALLLHGLGSIGVFIEVIATRLLIFSLIMIFLSIIAIALIVYVKFFTTRAIPGWATGAVSSMLIVLLQSFLLSLFTIFLYLSSQGQRKLIPALHYEDYVQSVETFNNG
jgi:polyisoprenyl-phosphate glycosyltransferase